MLQYSVNMIILYMKLLKFSGVKNKLFLYEE